MANRGQSLGELKDAINVAATMTVYGKITRSVGLVLEGYSPITQVGGLVEILSAKEKRRIPAEVVGFRDNLALMMPLGDATGIAMGSRIVPCAERVSVAVGKQLLGRVINGLGVPIDGSGPLACDAARPVYSDPLNPLHRPAIEEPLNIGVRAMNALLTVGKGQRLAIMAGSGVGKSVLMGMIARNTAADVNVIALIGERGREVREFIERDLGAEGLARSVVIASTGDESPLVRIRASNAAMAIAEYFRDHGNDVLLMMDSVTRYAMAQREIGLAIGEPPTTKGYTPSVFAALPKLLERAGTHLRGTITGLFTVLIEADDFHDPIGDSVRSIVDGHILLSRELATRNHFPAIDILHSASRVMKDIGTEAHLRAAGRLRELLATFQAAEDLINIGAYVPNSNPKIDLAIQHIDAINGFLQQDRLTACDLQEAISSLELVIAPTLSTGSPSALPTLPIQPTA